VKALADRGFSILSIDTEETIDSALLNGFETILSCIGPEGQLSQLNLATAAKTAGVNRFVPCGYITICPPGGIMRLRDEKEEVHNHIFKLHLGYTIIDTGYWHQISFPKLPSGRVDYASVYVENEFYDDGEAPNLLTDLRDIGRFVARIIKDERTLNKRVFTWSNELSQKQIYAIAEELSGEKVEYKTVSTSDIEKRYASAKAAFAGNPYTSAASTPESMALWSSEYLISKYIRKDNTRDNALYLGYLDAKELYPDFKPVTFEDFAKELLQGGIARPYKEKFEEIMKLQEALSKQSKN
jgi:hypothetical protein